MEETRLDKIEHSISDLKCQNILPEKDKQNLEKVEALKGEKDVHLVMFTPEKPNEALHTKHKNQADELPEKYRALSEFFYRMTCSLRLLKLCRKRPTFEDLCKQVDVLTKRKFSYKHLAQIKFLLPEAVQTHRILIHDKKTLCMKPEMNITLLFDVVEDHHEQSPYRALHQIFEDRLLNFTSKNPEASEIPKAELPDLFNKEAITAVNSLPVTSSVEILPTSSEAELLNPSHLNPTFSKHFSVLNAAEDEGKPQLLPSLVSLSSKADECETNTAIPQEKPSPDPNSKTTIVTVESTPLKVDLKADNLMVETPAQMTPKRSMPTCDEKIKSVTSQKWIESNISTKRFLDFSYLEGENSILNSASDENKHNHDLGKVEGSSSLQNLATSINQIFQTVKCSSITKEELVHKIIMNDFDIIDSREVEEQIELLEKLVPDWICKKVTPTGGFLYNIKKVSDLNSVCERLVSI